MGSTNVGHTFTHYDWRMGVDEIKEKTREEYGHRQGYSGQLHDIDRISLHTPTVKFKDMNDVWRYVDQRLDRLDKREGEVMSLGIVSYSIAKPVVKEIFGRVAGRNPWDLRDLTKRGPGPAYLFRVGKFGYVEFIASGKVADLKKQACARVIKEKFEHDYYIDGRNLEKPLKVTGEGKMVKSTSRKSDANTLVLPYHKWVVYGWAPE